MEKYAIIIFWIAIFVVFYAYVGYGILLYFLVRLKRLFKESNFIDDNYQPDVTVMVAAYNEQDYIRDKIKNCEQLDYNKDKLKFIFVTDGSSDSTPDIIKEYEWIQLLHQPERAGKIAAVHRAMPYVQTEIVVFMDANTEVNSQAIKEIVKHFADPKVGAVAGEKRIKLTDAEEAAGAGEGIYWKYESALKKWDSELYSVVGAAGELFAIRTNVYEPVPRDSIIEDFFMTMRIAMRGFRVRYEPKAYAYEDPSFSVQEELKRKVRICAGGIQSIIRLSAVLNFFKYGVLTFQYVSHRALRWSLAPLMLPLIFILNIYLAMEAGLFYQALLVGQILFYLMAVLGFMLEKRRISVKILFVPYYFSVMNYSVFAGMRRYYKGNQSVLWEKAKRRN